MKTITTYLAFLLLFVMGTTQLIQAQSKQKCTVKGVLLDSISNQPEPYATMRITVKGQTKPIAMGLTGKDGSFSASIPWTGSYRLVLSSIGKSPTIRDFTIKEMTFYDAGNLYITESSRHLKEVEVVAAKPLVKADIDKIEYNIADDPDSQTKTVLEMLRKVPMVTVDGQDNIKVNGSSSFKVHVNGKPNTMMSNNPTDVLKSLPANSIKKIEVITDPGAKYDAEGVAGILNIITDAKTKLSGYNASFRANVGNRQLGGGLYSTVQYGKLTFSLNYGTGKYKSSGDVTTSDREYLNDKDNHFLRSSSETYFKNFYQYGNLDGSYEIDSLNLISFSGGLFGSNNKNTGGGFTRMFSLEERPIYRYEKALYNKSSLLNLNFGLDYQRNFRKRKGEMLTFSYRMNTAPRTNKNNSYYTLDEELPPPSTLFLNDLSSDSHTNFQEHTGQVDYTVPWKKMHTLSVGVKFIYRLNKSNGQEYSRPTGDDSDFVRDDERSIRYRNVTDIAAAYSEYKLNWKKLSFKAGARYEYSYMSVSYPDGKRDDFHSDFSNLVPSVSLGYKLTDTRNIRLGYNMRIRRPDIYYLNPYVDRSDPTSISYGDPNLGTTKGHNLQISYGSFSPKLSLNMSVGYRFSNDGLSSYAFMDKEGILHQTYGNIVNQKGVNMNMYLNWMLTKTTTFNMNSSVGYEYYQSDILGQRKDGWTGYFSGGLQQTLFWKIRASIWAGGGTRAITLQGTGSGYYYYSLNFSRAFLKEDRLNISCFFSNPFPRHRTFKSLTETKDFIDHVTSRYDNISCGLSVSFRIGKLQTSVKKTARSIENDDVQSGGGSSSKGGGGGK